MADRVVTEEEKLKIEEKRQKAIAILKLKRQTIANGSNAAPKPTIAKPPPVPYQNGAGPSGIVQPTQLTHHKTFPPQFIVTGTCTLISRTRFAVDMAYNAKAIEIFKTIPSRVYDTAAKKWNFLLEDHQKLVAAMRPLRETVVIGELPKWITTTFNKATPTIQIPEENLSRVGDTLNASLLPFQREGVRFGIWKKGRVLIADDMGLGKTIQAIAIAAYYRSEWPLLIVCPSSVRYAWAEELERWLPSISSEEVVIVDTTKTEVSHATVVITSYDMLTRKQEELRAMDFQVVILDESHFLKTWKSGRTKAAQLVTGRTRRVILLSGTPALSRPSELFTQIGFINNNLFPNIIPFGIRYCNSKKTTFGWNHSGSANMAELHLLLEETIMIRRMKSDVISQLPAKRRQVVQLDPKRVCTTNKTMKVAAAEMQNESLKGMERKGALMKYFNQTGAAKLPAICEYIKDLLESGKKFLCFAHHRKVIEGICETIKAVECQFICIDGATPGDKRQEYCHGFQFKDEIRVAVLSITAANTGLTLTAGALVVFAELFWNPGILTQAEDRAHRIGQEDCVLVQYLVAKGTADDYIWPLVQKKLEVLNQAGLSKDNFSDADTTSFHTSSSIPTTSRPIEDFFAKFLEDDLPDEEVREAEDAEGGATANKRMKITP